MCPIRKEVILGLIFVAPSVPHTCLFPLNGTRSSGIRSAASSLDSGPQAFAPIPASATDHRDPSQRDGHAHVAADCQAWDIYASGPDRRGIDSPAIHERGRGYVCGISDGLDNEKSEEARE